MDIHVHIIPTLRIWSSSYHNYSFSQSTAVAFDEVTERNVYLCTGQPLPTDIAKIVEWMLNESFSTAYESIYYIYSLPQFHSIKVYYSLQIGLQLCINR